MAKKFTKITVNLADDRIKQLDALCAVNGSIRSAVIRKAIDAFLDRPDGVITNFGRIAKISEFTQVAVDILINEQAPDRRDDIIATVEERMKQYHAQG
jgi:metal-responsive CopG/Arc/MetJ family transcriptional regulator